MAPAVTPETSHFTDPVPPLDDQYLASTDAPFGKFQASREHAKNGPVHYEQAQTEKVYYKNVPESTVYGNSDVDNDEYVAATDMYLTVADILPAGKRN